LCREKEREREREREKEREGEGRYTIQDTLAENVKLFCSIAYHV